MKYIKTYENIFSGLFINKNIKKIISAINKLLFNAEWQKSDDIQKIKNFSKWLYYNNKNSAYLLIKQPGNAASIKNIYIDITVEKQWIEIMVKKYNIMPELLYIKSILIEYGSFIPENDSFNSGFDKYHLALDKIDIFIKKLDIKDFNLYQTKSKYNL